MRELFVPGQVHPEAEYEELAQLGRRLGLPVPQMHLRVEAINPDGSLGDVWEGRSRTVNRNFWNVFFSVFGYPALVTTSSFGAGFMSVKRQNASIFAIGGSWQGVGSDNSNPNQVGALGETGKGFVAGTGTAGESFEGFAMSSICTEGTGSNQFNYQAMTQATPSYDSGTKTWTSSQIRRANNNGSGTIGVNEIAIFNQLTYWNGSQFATDTTFMTCRDKLGITVSVSPAGQLTITYVFTLTFPA